LVGWMPKKEAKKLRVLTKDDPRITVLDEDPRESAKFLKTPTKLRNIPLFRPFEEFVKMYGTPSYEEIDPTPILSIFYILFFGLMFGDVGHGICIALIGLLFTALKKGGFLAKILTPIGLSATFFGFMYGTFFGFEGTNGIISPIWFTPMESAGSMNKILIITIIIGMLTVITSMVINIANGIKQKSVRKIIFSQNGIAGLVLYTSILYGIYEYVMVPGDMKYFSVIVWLAIISLLAIFLQEPLFSLIRKISKKRGNGSEEHASIVEAIFEVIEVMLSLVTNTISFARIGAFTLSHAGIMSAIIMFMRTFPRLAPIIAIIGNIFVIGFEGLIVGIQTLRLGYYEMFSRFYSGDGVEFVPLCECR
jgi:V/A-type H+-transporting ATPase subunit I